MTTIYRFCPRCAQPLRTRAEGGFPRQACPDAQCGFVWWDNPTPVVAAVVEHDGEVVLARNKLWTYRFFGLVTGFLERNEIPHEAVLREVDEELGLKSDTATLIGHYTFERMNQLIIAYHVPATGEIRLGEELAEYIRVPLDQARYWPAATGLALRDWLQARGFDPQPIELPTRPKA